MSVLTGAVAAEDDKAVLDWTWAFILTEVDDVSCRLLVRVRADYRPRILRGFFPLVLEPVHFCMELKMLHTIKRRATQPVLTNRSFENRGPFAEIDGPLVPVPGEWTSRWWRGRESPERLQGRSRT